MQPTSPQPMSRTTPHHATPEQWASLEHYCKRFPADTKNAGSCLIEVRDRLSQLEQLLGVPCQRPKVTFTPPLTQTANTSVRVSGSFEHDGKTYHFDAPAASTPEPAPDPEPEPSLVSMVAVAVGDGDSEPELWTIEARAAIQAVAKWLEAQGCDYAASQLTDEVE